MTEFSGKELTDVFDVRLPSRPYPGLRPFAEHEWSIFFGRERMLDEVVRLLLKQQLVVVHGDSGCGKSSLIQAGVLPRLRHESARGRVRCHTCTALPREGPLANLARAVAGIDGRPHDAALTLEVRRILNFGRDAAASLAALLRREVDGHSCILIDQFEELFEHSRRHGPEEARLITQLLIGLFEERPPGFNVIITMRSEFLGACARFPGFAETVNATQYLLPRMTHADLVRAIREPAQLYDGEVSAELTERLIADAGGGQDQLPLIQHGLMRLYEDKVGGAVAAAGDRDVTSTGALASGPRWRLTVEDQRAGGGPSALLSAHADMIADQAARKHLAGEPNRERVTEDLFRALTDINPDGQGIRRPVRLSELVAVTGAQETAVRGVIDAFRADGVSFLTPYGDQPIVGDKLIDIGHEALIRCWTKVADPADGWLQREFRNGLVWRSLLVQADSFDSNPANVLSAATTEEREQWLRRRSAAWAKRYGGGWERVVKLIEASVQARERDLREEEEERRRRENDKLRDQELAAERLVGAERARRVRSLRRLSWLLVVFLVLAVGAGVLAWDKAGEARQEAEFARQQVQLANEYISLAEQQRTVNERTTSALRSVAADLTAGEVARAATSVRAEVAKLDTPFPASIIPPLDSVIGSQVYIHIADESQRAMARRIERLIERSTFQGRPVLVPGIELVRTSPRRAELRCFRVADCKGYGERLVELLDPLLQDPVVLADLSASYGATAQIRPRQYELWLASDSALLNAGDVTAPNPALDSDR